MKPFGKILVPVDLTRRSVGAARYAAGLGSEFQSELVFVHALRNGWPLSDTARRVRDVIMSFEGSTPGKFVMREGEPVPVILDVAGAEAVDLILMPTRGVPALPRLFHKSITAQVMRGASCPVWTAVNDRLSQPGSPIRNILCGVSLAPRAASVLRWAAALALRMKATLTLIHASKDFETMPAYPCDGEWRHWQQALAKDEIEALQSSAGTEAGLLLAAGKPLAAIPRLAKSLRADLLVIGKSPQRRLLGDLRIMSYEMVRRSPCPVASV